MELHATGASFIAQTKEANPIDLVKLVVEKMPNAGRKERFAEFEELLAAEGEVYERAVRWYFFVNMHDYLTTRRSSPANSASRTSKVEDIVNKVREAVLLDLVMPNEKRLRDCTGAECAKFGGFYAKIARKVGKTKIVGEVLNEVQIRALLA